MNTPAPLRPEGFRDPAGCIHERIQRIGIQRFPFAPYRLFLVTCRACGTTLTTLSIRGQAASVPA